MHGCKQLPHYSTSSSSGTSHSETARMTSEGVQTSMAPNTIACMVVMDRSPNSKPQQSKLTASILVNACRDRGFYAISFQAHAFSAFGHVAMQRVRHFARPEKIRLRARDTSIAKLGGQLRSWPDHVEAESSARAGATGGADVRSLEPWRQA